MNAVRTTAAITAIPRRLSALPRKLEAPSGLGIVPNVDRAEPLHTSSRPLVSRPDHSVRFPSVSSRDSGAFDVDRVNDTRVDFSPEQTVVEHIERHAAGAPEALAVSDGRTALTYRELDARANRLARVLREHGGRAEACVALCVAPSVEMVAGALAALKAGAAYVPIDPEYPRERAALILDDTAPAAVLVDATTPAAVLASASKRAISLDEDPEHHDAAARDATQLEERPDLGSLAYVVYTSGSTGRPKGVEVEHCSLANLALAMAWACGTTPGDRVAQTAAPAFDATVMEIWHPLVAGASLHIAPPGMRRDPRRLVGWLAEREISITMVPTALVSMLFGTDALYRRLTTRRLMTGGAALLTRPGADCAFPLVNMYGPTETTVVATQGVIPPEGDVPPTIGRPLANVRAYVLDDERRPVGAGEIGEIWIGGAQVARGYRGRPDLTAERFLPDPFVASQDSRMYRTGDLGSWRADGRLDFHGRVDDQISIRGYRIEPQEVESALKTLSTIVDVVVVAVQHGRRGEQLAAYYTATDRAPTVAEIRAHLRAILPEYMVPTAYVRVERFQLTPNGKIDHRALPEPVLVRDELDDAYVAPRDEREERIAAIFADVLDIDRVGIEDDFFALGGDSLDAVTCVTQVGDELGIDIAVQELYAHPTVAQLVAALDAGGADRADEGLDWEAETHPGLEGVTPLPRPRRGDSPRGVMVTGASGFLGPHLLAALAAATREEGGRVFALVRAPSREAGAERLRRALVAERRDIGADWERVVVVPGDLTEPRLGLSEDEQAELAREVGSIYHNGALVHHLYDYRRLKAANVDGTREALRLALLAGGCPFHYVSTVSTALEIRDGRLVERSDAAHEPPYGSGYAESKWVAERMVLAAADDGLPCQAVRLPRAMGGTHSGATSTHDAAVRLLRGCIELGAYPQWTGWEPWAPVDVIAEALAASPFELDDAPRVAYPPAAIASFMHVFRAAAAYGFALEPVPVSAWRQRLRDHADTNAATAVQGEFGLDPDDGVYTQGDVPPGRGWQVAPLLPGPECPPVDAEYVWRMLDYLTSVGYLPRPDQIVQST